LGTSESKKIIEELNETLGSPVKVVNGTELSESARQTATTLSEISTKIQEHHNSGFSISSLLETPFESSLGAIPDIPRFLVPGTHGTPLIIFNQPRKKKIEGIQIISDLPYTGSIPPVSFPSTSEGPLLVQVDESVVIKDDGFTVQSYEELATAVQGEPVAQEVNGNPTLQHGSKLTSKLISSREDSLHVSTLDFDWSKTPSSAGNAGLTTERKCREKKPSVEEVSTY
jgi:hypothetical protein